MNKEISKNQGIVIILFNIVVLIYLLFDASFNFDALHDGTIYKACRSVAYGKLLYKDVHTQYGALFTYVQALFIKIFGDRLYVMKASGCVFIVGCHVLFFVVFRRFLPYLWVMIGEVLLVLLATYNYYILLPWATYLAVFFLILSVLFVLIADERSNDWLYFCAGIACACSFFCKQPVGALLLIAYIVTGIIWKLKWKKRFCLGKLLLGVLLVFGIFTIVFVIQGTLEDWYRQNIREALEFWDSNSTLSNRWNKIIVYSEDTKTLSKADSELDVVTDDARLLLSNLLKSRVGNRIVKFFGCLFPINDYVYSWMVPTLCVLFLIWSFFRDRTEEAPLYTFLGIIACTVWGCCYIPVSTRANRWYAFYFMIGYILILIKRLIDSQREKKIPIYRIAVVLAFFSMFVLPIYNNFFAVKDYEGTHIFMNEKTTGRCVGMINKINTFTQCWDDDRLPQLIGMKMSQGQYDYYKSVADKIEMIKHEYPNRPIYNYNVLYLLTIVQDISFDYPVYIDDYEVIMKYLMDEKPIVITYSSDMPNYAGNPLPVLLDDLEGYERIDEVSLDFSPILYLDEGNGESLYFWAYTE